MCLTLRQLFPPNPAALQEHFFAVLRDSREDEKFFASVTNYIRTSVNRLANARRRRILLKRR